MNKLLVTRDGEVTHEYDPKLHQTLLQALRQALTYIVDRTLLEVRMIAFDAFNGTHYRKARKELLRQRRKDNFETYVALSLN